MIKKIPSSKLRVGMFVDHIDRRWLDNPFFKKQFEITSQKQIDKFREYGIETVYIDTAKGVDVQKPFRLQACVFSPDPKNEKCVNTSEQKPSQPPPTFKKIERVYAASYQTTRKLMNDVRLGKLVDTREVTHTVENLIDQILNDPEAIIGLSKLQDYDDYTYTHSLNVCIFSLAVGRALGFSREKLSDLGIGALIHDFGKMLVPLKILNKPGKLTRNEFEIMKEHVSRGVAYIKQLSGISSRAIEVAQQHHERHSGRGYPLGLKGDEISEFGKIAAVVDVYDAITSDRVYHRGMIPNKALQKIFEWRYNDFDPRLVEMFIKVVGIYPLGSLTLLNDGRVAMVIEGNPHNSVLPKVLPLFDNTGKQIEDPQVLDLSRHDSLRIQQCVEPETLDIDSKKLWERWGSTKGI